MKHRSRIYHGHDRPANVDETKYGKWCPGETRETIEGYDLSHGGYVARVRATRDTKDEGAVLTGEIEVGPSRNGDVSRG